VSREATLASGEKGSYKATATLIYDRPIIPRPILGHERRECLGANADPTVHIVKPSLGRRTVLDES
jgi:hypothetical protein